MTDVPAAGRKAENPWLKLGLELGPLLVFFFANGRFGIFIATGAFMAAMAASESVPLLGSAIWSMANPWGLEVPVDVFQGEALGDHHDLRMVEELRELLRRAVLALVLRGDPDLAGLLVDFLADEVYAFLELLDGAGTLRAVLGFDF